MDSYLFRGHKTSFLDRPSIKLTLLRRRDVTYRCKDNNYSYWSFPTFLNTPTREIYCTTNLHSGFSTLLPMAFKLSDVYLRYAHTLMENWHVLRVEKGKAEATVELMGLLKVKKEKKKKRTQVKSPWHEYLKPVLLYQSNQNRINSSKCAMKWFVAKSK